VNNRQSRQNPARAQYSQIDFMFQWRLLGHGCAPGISDKRF